MRCFIYVCVILYFMSHDEYTCKECNYIGISSYQCSECGSNKLELKELYEYVYEDIKLIIPSRYYHENLLGRFKANRYENPEKTLIEKYFDKNDNVLEFGTCLGYTAAILSHRVNKVISIEANPELEECLKKFKDINKLSNLELLNAYISNTKDEVEFQTYDNIVAGSADREIIKASKLNPRFGGFGKNLKIYKLKTRDLGSIKNINEINSLVIDIEGGEVAFLIENEEFLNSIDKILIELHGFFKEHKKKGGTDKYNQKCIDILYSYGFCLKDNILHNYYFEKDEADPK